jgi:putative tryptophan/tyrosine transport system substrate-binding protein
MRFLRIGISALTFLMLVTPKLAVAQPAGKVPRIGLTTAGPADCKLSLRDESLYRGFRDFGYVIGRNIRIDRKCFGNAEEARRILAGFVVAKVDVIMVGAPGPAIMVRDMTRDIPIVCWSCGDPLDNGLVASLSRPGGNVTGLASLSAELIGKRLGLLKEAIPRISRVAAVINPDNPGTRPTLKALDEASRILNLEILRVEFRTLDDFERVLRSAAEMGAGALLLQDDPLVYARRKQIAELALKLRLPASAGLNELVDEGLLMSYGPDRNDMLLRSAGYVDRILKGTKPGDLPFEQPAKFDLNLNLRTAKAIGVAFPSSILVQATRVIK